MEKIRIQKFLSEAGVCSRRSAEKWLLEGRIAVNGQILSQVGTRIDPETDTVEVDGKVIKKTERETIVIALHKPPGYLCSERDPQQRRTVYELLPEDLPRVFSIGRLDWHSEGLLLFTNDGELANAMMHPSTQVLREYEVKVKGHPTKRAVATVAKGFMDDGYRVVPMELTYLRRTQKNCWYRVVLSEGRYHEVRRLFEHGDLQVLRLKRISYGPVELRRLELTETRQLSTAEVQLMKDTCKLGQKRRRLGAQPEEPVGPPRAK
ncbi:MAG: pseudouridine synthase [Myxococcales bacterium]|nr:pseudouridine synthase [Myxococcales bacterium]|tara:strand:- start:113 stop:904 length:792 start_codon:yes stop_codon:yes gene_type:complete